MKHLHPSTHLLLGLTPILCLALSSAVMLPLAPRAVAQSAAGTAYTPTIAEQYLLAAANQERTRRNLPLLHLDPRLARAAGQHAQAMAEHGSLSHQFPGESDLTHRAANAGVAFSRVSENVGEAPSVAELQRMWMASTLHRANLLDPTVDAAGIRVVSRNGQLYAVEDFARTVASASLEEQESAIGALVAQTGRIALDAAPDAIATARRTCALSSGYAGARRPGFVMRFTASRLTRLPSELKTRLASGRYSQATVGACPSQSNSPFTTYNIAVMLFR